MVLEGAELLSAALDADVPVESAYVAPEGRDDPAVSRVLEEVYRGAGESSIWLPV